MTADERVLRHYLLNDEAGRLWATARGELTRRRTWDIFERFLPESGRVAARLHLWPGALFPATPV
ncbi:hypothetical protein [Microbispora sp. KK1-11]|uniref:hypothetical protein n=1 Tax=Microbispora sp. KK1-11 TaxID=2053005 RepID=UPI0011587AE2|nr:hypothetical protein [Microbispora sp. KK1-11]TQS21588.1 hypothetical protein FLW16_39140 [Microbispora sp. KK1-11]